MIYKALFLSFLLLGCQSPYLQQTKVQKYSRTINSFSEHKEQVNIAVRYANKEQLNFMYSKYSPDMKALFDKEGLVFGFAVQEKEFCVLYIERKPTSSNDAAYFHTLGHELYHCLKGGDFH